MDRNRIKMRKALRMIAHSAVLAAVLLGSLMLSGCGSKQQQQEKQPPDPDSIRTFYFQLGYIEVKYDLPTRTISAGYTYDEQPVEAKLTGAEADRYEKALRSFCADVSENYDQFRGDPGEEAYAIWWYFEASCDDGTIRRGEANSEGRRVYPEGWDDFIDITTKKTGVDVRAEADEYIPDYYKEIP